MKIGLFDSGLGGLLILKAVAKELSEYDYEYYGDTANLPYGDKNEEEIYELTKAGVEHLFEKDCLVVILACNTASAETLRRLQEEFLPEKYPDRKILGVIIPVVEEFINSDCERATLIATKRTVSSGKYHLELGKRNEFQKKIEAVATPELALLLEAGELQKALSVAKQIVGEIDQVGEARGVILGCTHYVLLKDTLREAYGEKVKIFSQDEIIPRSLKNYFERHAEIENKLTRTGARNIYLTEHRAEYDGVLKSFLDGQFINR